MPGNSAQHGHASSVGLAPLAIGVAASVAIHAAALLVLMLDDRGLFESARQQPSPAGDPVRVTLTRPSNSDAAALLEMSRTTRPIETLAPTTKRLNLPVAHAADARLKPEMTSGVREAPSRETTPSPSHVPPASAADPGAPELPKLVLESVPTPEQDQAATGPRPGLETGIEIMRLVEPLYPERCVRNGDEGDVVVSIEVLADGSIGQTRVHESSGNSLLDRAAVRAAQRCRFQPATLDGSPVSSEILVPFEFRIRD